MSRLPRVAISGHPHHITQRGNRKADVFMDEMDRHIYIKHLVLECARYGVKIWSYCLMCNHVHLIAVPEHKDSLSDMFQRVHGDYAGYFNAKYTKSGHLWQGRFKSTVLDTRHLWNAVRYVERNPVRAGIVRHAQDYPWSSAAAHCGLRADRVLSDDLPLLEDIPDWRAWLAEQEREDDLKFIRNRTRTGRPCADDDFIKRMEIELGRRLLRQKSGPKSKEEKFLYDNRSLQLPVEFGD